MIPLAIFTVTWLKGVIFICEPMDFTEIQELNKLINYSHSYDAAPIIKEHGRENNAKDLQATHYVSIAEAGFSEIE